jgi:hypothetical protein
VPLLARSLLPNFYALVISLNRCAGKEGEIFAFSNDKENDLLRNVDVVEACSRLRSADWTTELCIGRLGKTHEHAVFGISRNAMSAPSSCAQ